MLCDGVVTGVRSLAKHKVAGSTPVTRSEELGRPRVLTTRHHRWQPVMTGRFACGWSSTTIIAADESGTVPAFDTDDVFLAVALAVASTDPVSRG
jgi:hypothetical protein